jgi:hypothetical protein
MSLRRFRRSAFAIVSGALAVSMAWAAPAGAAQHPALGNFGSANQPVFTGAKGVAVDQATGDVLVIDAAAGTVSRFHADGTPAPFSALGSNAIDGVGPEDGTPNGALKFNSGPGGAFQAQVAVDSSGGVADGDIYVTQFAANVVDIFSEAGKYLGQLTNEPNEEPVGFCGVAVDGMGDVFVGSYEPQLIYRYEPTSNPPTDGDRTASFATLPRPCNISAGVGPTDGALFVSPFRGAVYKLDAVTGEYEYEVAEGENNPTTSVDPVTGNVLIANGATVREIDASSPLGPRVISTIAVGREVEGLGVDGTSGHIYVSPSAVEVPQRLGATRLLEYGPLTPFAPQITAERALGVAGREATVEAKINPEGQSTAVQVEYGPSGSYGNVTAAINVGSGEELTPALVTLKGLTPGQTYHFRFVATNGVGTSRGSDQTFTTARVPGGEAGCLNSALRTGPAARMADCRAYEMVSPVEKNGVDISSLLSLNNNFVELDQTATSGERLTYSSLQGFAEPQGTPYTSQYLASRTPAGWSDQSITPSAGTNISNPSLRLALEFQIFSPGLCTGLLNHYADPPLAPGASEGAVTTYRWSDRSDCGTDPSGYETVSTVSPGGGEGENPPLIQGLSADEQCALYVPIEAGRYGNLYENCQGQNRQVNLLPDGTASSQGRVGTTVSGETMATLRASNYQGAVSTDGSRVYWSSAAIEGGSSSGAPLYVRVNAQEAQSSLGPGNECLEAVKACTVAVSEQPALFWGASPTGSRAIYTVENELYEFDLATGQSTRLASEVAGVMGVDAQATRVYFVSDEALSGHGTQGKPNLYLYDATKEGIARFQFIATVAPADANRESSNSAEVAMISLRPSFRAVRLSPDGLHAVFASRTPLTGYDNTDAVSGEPDLEVFLYDATADGGSGSLTCISCNPSGQAPRGINVEVEQNPFASAKNWAAALVPPYATSFYGSRVITDDGSRVFFDSYEALLPADTNGKEDVYEWEASGSGPAAAKCTEGSSSYSPANGGCLSLISSAESASDSEFVDASPDGRDVFFKTASSLVPQDPGLVDIYDAREEGGFPPAPGLSPSCEGEACQGPVSPPNDQTPASAAFSGPGNAVECAKGKVKKNGRCVAKKSSAKKPHKKKNRKKKNHKKKPQAKKKGKQTGGDGRANDNGRAGR